MPQEGRVQVAAERGGHGRPPPTIGYVVDTLHFFAKVTVSGRP